MRGKGKDSETGRVLDWYGGREGVRQVADTARRLHDPPLKSQLITLMLSRMGIPASHPPPLGAPDPTILLDAVVAAIETVVSSHTAAVSTTFDISEIGAWCTEAFSTVSAIESLLPV